MSIYDDSGDCQSTRRHPITIDQHVGLCIVAHREAVGLSVPATAAKIGVPVDVLAAIEAGAARPTAPCLIMLGLLLDIKITDLFLGYVSTQEQIARSKRRRRERHDSDNIVALPDRTH